MASAGSGGIYNGDLRLFEFPGADGTVHKVDPDDRLDMDLLEKVKKYAMPIIYICYLRGEFVMVLKFSGIFSLGQNKKKYRFIQIKRYIFFLSRISKRKKTPYVCVTVLYSNHRV